MASKRQHTDSRSLTPEQRELEQKAAELVELETLLAQAELELATLQAALHAFEAIYVRIVGTVYSELDEIEARIAEAEAQRNTDDPQLREVAEEARAKATESADATGAALQRKQEVDFAPAEELKKLYREIAKRIHPDLTTDEKERVRRNRIMMEANRAYEDSDEAKLRAILEEWQASPESVEGEGVAAELVRTIRKIYQVQRRLTDIAAETKQLTSSDLYDLKLRVDLARSNGQDVLAQMAAQVKAQIRLARIRLAELNPKT
jgi:hypothetical protein